MVDSVKIPVTIKIRTGWDQDSRNAQEVIRVATDAGIRWVAIHGRTRAQGYSGLADWDFIGEVKAKAQIPIIGNGDVATAEQALSRLRTYGVDAVMIGRAALRNPFLFEQAEALWRGESPRKLVAQDYLNLLREQRILFQETYPEKSAMIHARKFLGWYSAGFPGSHEYRRQVFSISEPEELWRRSYEFFEDSTKTRDLRELDEPFLMGGHG
jgi:nifR3 family TIM-barrel protein